MTMDKGDLLPQDITVKDRPSDAIKIAKIITLGVFFTTLVTVCVFFAARYGSMASTEAQHCPIQVAKVMDKDLTRERDLKTTDGKIVHERFTYDQQSNSVMVQTPGNISGDSPATLVIDYNRALVFAHVRDEDSCLVYSLPDDFGKSLRQELSATDRNVIDVANTILTRDNYMVAGEIPRGFVQSSSGPMVYTMCAGRTTYWLDQVEQDLSNVGEKRGVCINFRVCAGFICYTDRVCF